LDAVLEPLPPKLTQIGDAMQLVENEPTAIAEIGTPV